jgi:hypothetical protein
MKHFAIVTLLALSTSACVSAGGSATEQTICRELGAVLPTYSTSDTEQTKEDGDRFLTVFDAVC